MTKNERGCASGGCVIIVPYKEYEQKFKALKDAGETEEAIIKAIGHRKVYCPILEKDRNWGIGCEVNDNTYENFKSLFT